MNLLLTVPAGVLVDRRVTKVVADADFGSFVLLPKHADVAALLVPGLLSFLADDEAEVFVAVDHGVLVKAGADVRVTCQRAALAGDLASAEETVRERFAVRSESEKRARTTLAQLETEILKRVAELRR